MKGVCFSASIACVFVSGAALAQAPATDALPAVDACVGRLDPELDIGYDRIANVKFGIEPPDASVHELDIGNAVIANDRIAARCPELVKQLDHGAWAAWLPRGWKEPGNDLSAGSLKEFRELVERESAASDTARVPDIRQLKSVLHGLAGTSKAGWWSGFKSWLRSILEKREEPTDDSWFT